MMNGRNSAAGESQHGSFWDASWQSFDYYACWGDSWRWAAWHYRNIEPRLGGDLRYWSHEHFMMTGLAPMLTPHASLWGACFGQNAPKIYWLHQYRMMPHMECFVDWGLLRWISSRANARPLLITTEKQKSCHFSASIFARASAKLRDKIKI